MLDERRHGRIEILRHESRALAGNPLGDEAAREVAVYLPPDYDAAPERRFPVIFFLAGFTGSWRTLLNHAAWAPPLPHRWDAELEAGRATSAIVVMPDCFTRYGGSQYVDSPAIGQYATYVCDELVPLVDGALRTLPRREARAVAGKSSGGYGALHLGLTRPELFSAIASHAGDSAFDLSYQREFGHVAMALERRGGVRGYLSWFEALPAKPGSTIDVMSHLCCAAAWSPRAEGPYGFGEGFELPFHPLTGGVRDDVWARWLNHDPVRMLERPEHIEAARSMRAIYLDAGLGDEYNLQLGTRQVRAALARAGVECTHDEFDGGHMNTSHRYARSYGVISRSLGG